jgi:hypothetical protein
MKYTITKKGNMTVEFTEELFETANEQLPGTKAPKRLPVGIDIMSWPRDQATPTKALLLQRRRMAALLDDSLTPKQRSARARRR